jgi:FimV-like protein
VVSRKYLATATAGGFAPGLLREAEFMALAADAMAGTVNASSYRNRLLVLQGKVDAAQSMLSDAIDVELAASLHESGDKDGARRLLETVLAREHVEVNARAAAWLEHGRIFMAAGSASDRSAYRSAMLDFLRVRLETRDCWRNLQAEALLQAGVAAQRWQGEDWRFIQGRCRAILIDEFAGTEWAKKVQTR